MAARLGTDYCKIIDRCAVFFHMLSTCSAKIAQRKWQIDINQIVASFIKIGEWAKAAHFQFHQALRGKADHVAQKITIGALPNQRIQVHLIIGHRCRGGQ